MANVEPNAGVPNVGAPGAHVHVFTGIRHTYLDVGLHPVNLQEPNNANQVADEGIRGLLLLSTHRFLTGPEIFQLLDDAWDGNLPISPINLPPQEEGLYFIISRAFSDANGWIHTDENRYTRSIRVGGLNATYANLQDNAGHYFTRRTHRLRNMYGFLAMVHYFQNPQPAAQIQGANQVQGAQAQDVHGNNHIWFDDDLNVLHEPPQDQDQAQGAAQGANPQPAQGAAQGAAQDQDQDQAQGAAQGANPQPAAQVQGAAQAQGAAQGANPQPASQVQGANQVQGAQAQGVHGNNHIWFDDDLNVLHEPPQDQDQAQGAAQDDEHVNQN